MSLQTVYERYFTSDLTEQFKGFFHKTGSSTTQRQIFNLGEKSWSQRCKHYDDIFNTHSLAKSQTLTIAGQILSNDTFLEAPRRIIGGGTLDNYPEADRAKAKCEELNEDIGINLLIHDTAINLVKYGSSFCEKTLTPDFNVRMMPQLEKLQPYTQNDIGDISAWKLVANYAPADAPVFHVPDEIIHFPWNVTSVSWPYGTSLYTGLDTEFKILSDLENNIRDHMNTTAHPKEVLGVGDRDYRPSSTDVSKIRTQFQQWRPGETVVTNYPIAYVAGGVVDREIGNLGEVLDFVKDQATDGLMMPPISKQYQSSYASSKEMTDWAQANLIIPMRRLIGRIIEREIYRPYVMHSGFSVRVVPKLTWEPPDMNREEDGEYYSKLVMAQVMPPIVAARELGFEEEYVKWHDEERAWQEKMGQQSMLGQQQQQQGQGRSWTVNEITRRRHHPDH